MIVEKIITYLASYLKTDASEIELIVQTVKKNNYLSPHDIMQFQSKGIPIITTISGVMGINSEQAYELARYDKDKHAGNITYQDTIILLGVIVQYFKLQQQPR